MERALWVAGLATALGLRIAAALERAGSAILLDQIDSQIYRNLAAAIRGGDWLPSQGFFMSPLYPYWVAAFPVEGTAPPALLVQSLLGTGAVAALAWLARWVGGIGAGLLTLWFGALAGSLILYDSAVLPDGPALALLAGSLVLAILRPRSARLLVVAGIFGALAYALRSNLLPSLLLVGTWLAWTARADRTAAAGRVTAFLAPTVVVLVGIGALNQRAEGVFVPRSINAGQNLYIGNNPSSDGTYTPVNEIHPGDMLGREAAQAASGRPLNAAEVDRFWRDHALDLMADRPGRTARLWWSKLRLVLHPYDVPQMESLTLEKHRSRALRLAFVGWGLVLPLAVAGLLSRWPERRTWLTPVALSGLVSVLVCVVFFVNGRLRHPIWITLLPLAGIGLADLWHGLRAHGSRRALRPLGFGLGLLLLVSLTPVHATYRDAMSASRYATLAGLDGDMAGARGWMAVADQLEAARPWWGGDPWMTRTFRDHPSSQWLLRLERAAAWFVLGDLRRAYQDMAPAAEGLPQSRRAQQGLVQICDRLLAQGAGDEVRVARERALQRLQRL